MSSSGVSATNSGPLAIRTYNSGSNKTFVLSDYDVPVPSNYILITSTNGLLIPSNSPTISSIQVSSIRDRDGFTGGNGEVLHTNGSTIFWAPIGAGSGYWTENGSIIYNNNGGNVGIGTTTPQATLDVAGQVRVAQGTAGTPAIYFSSDNDTGIYGIGNGQMGISANSAPRMLITNTDVTISPNPGNKFNVSNISNNDATVMAINNTGTVSTGSLLRLNTGNGGYGLYATQSEASAFGYQTAPSTFQIYSYYGGIDTNVLTIYPNGSTIVNGNLSVNGTINATQLSNTITVLQSQTSSGSYIECDITASFPAGTYQLQLCVLNMNAIGNFLSFFCANPATPTVPINYSANQVPSGAVGYNLCMNSGYFQHTGGNLRIILDSRDSGGNIQTPWTGTWSLQLVKIL